VEEKGFGDSVKYDKNNKYIPPQKINIHAALSEDEYAVLDDLGAISRNSHAFNFA